MIRLFFLFFFFFDKKKYSMYAGQEKLCDWVHVLLSVKRLDFREEHFRRS